MWGLEYEIEDLQKAFAQQLGDIDLANLTDDFVEDALLQSKPLQGVLQNIRLKQKVCMSINLNLNEQISLNFVHCVFCGALSFEVSHMHIV